MNIKILLIVIIFSALNLYSGDLSMNPENPNSGNEIIFNYSPDDRYTDDSKMYLFLYLFSENLNMPTAYQIELIKGKDSIYTGKFISPINSKFALLKIYGTNSSVAIDNNYGQYWDIIFTEKDKAVFNANLLSGLSYMNNFSENYSRISNYENALESFEKEYEAYPDNIQAQLALQTLLYDFKEIGYQDFQENVKEILDRNLNLENKQLIKSAIRALYMIDKKEAAENLKSAFLKKFPDSEFAKQNEIAEISKAKSLDEFSELTVKYLNAHQNDSNTEKLILALIDAHLQNGKYNELNKSMDFLINVPPYAYSKLAVEFLTNSNIKIPEQGRLNKAKEYLDSALNSLESYRKTKPKDITEIMWENNLKEIKSGIYLIGYEIYNSVNDTTKALNYLTDAIELTPEEIPSNGYKRAIEIHLSKNDTLKAELISKQVLINDLADDNLFTYIDSLISEEIFDINQNELIEYQNTSVEMKRRDKKYETFNGKEITGFVNRTDGSYYDLEEMKGKVTVLMTFSTWCGPCQAMFPTYEKLYFEYEANQDVNIFALNIWENQNNYDALKEMLKEQPVAFPILIDQSNILPRKLSVFGLPTIYVIDEEGKIRYKQNGFTNEETLLEEINTVIDIVK